VNDQPIQSAEQLFKIVSETPKGQSVEIEAQLINMQTGKVSKDTYSVKPRSE
jgi:PDZ domain-containing secreted protein